MGDREQVGPFGTKGGIKRWLIRAGRWDDALAFREALKKSGVGPAESWMRMAEQFLPQDFVGKGRYGLPPRMVGASQVDGLALPKPREYRKGPMPDISTLDYRLAVDWTLCALEVDPAVIDRESAPPGALMLYDWASESPEQCRDFMKTFAARLLPSKARVEAEEKERLEDVDDGDALEETIATIIEARAGSVLQAGADGGDGEPGVSAPGSEECARW